MDEGAAPVSQAPFHQPGRGLETARVEGAAAGRQRIAQRVGEARDLPGEVRRLPAHHLQRRRPAFGRRQPGIVPPRGVEARQGGDHALALRQAGRQRPGRGDGMRVGQVLEQQMPDVASIAPHGVEAARHQAGRQHRGDVAIEGDLLARAVAAGAAAVGMGGLEDQRARRAGGRALARQAQPDEGGGHGAEGRHDLDAADAAPAQHAGPAQSLRKIGGLGHRRQGRRHAPILRLAARKGTAGRAARGEVARN